MNPEKVAIPMILAKNHRGKKNLLNIKMPAPQWDPGILRATVAWPHSLPGGGGNRQCKGEQQRWQPPPPRSWFAKKAADCAAPPLSVNQQQGVGTLLANQQWRAALTGPLGKSVMGRREPPQKDYENDATCCKQPMIFLSPQHNWGRSLFRNEGIPDCYLILLREYAAKY